MKLIKGLILAAMVMFLGVGAASAAFVDGDIIAVAYSDTQEYYTKIGTLGSVTTATDGTVLGQLDLTGMTGIQIFASGNAMATSNDYVLFATKSSVDPQINAPYFTSTLNAMQNLENITLDQTLLSTRYITTLGSTGEVNNYNVDNLDGQITAGAEGMVYLYQYKYTNKLQVGTDGPYQVALNIGTDGTISVSQVPVPGAVWMLGSALLGLVGLRKKNA